MERADLASVAGVFAAAPVASAGRVTLDEEAAHHLRVRRIGQGERVRVLDGLGHVGIGVVARLAKRAVEVDVEAVEDHPPPPDVHLLLPVADRDRMLWLAEKAVELGVRGWHPVRWRRSRSVSPRGEGEAFRARVRARMASALVQSGGAWLPGIAPEGELDDVLARATSGHRFLLDAGGTPLLTLCAGDLTTPVWIAVGPEGGVEREERERVVAAGFAPARLGPTVLRFETAGVCAVAVLRAVSDAASRGLDRS
ncbi:MAG TPA: RsmE family RNA methyltransferase [Gemmatimonadaceae bacterium]|nr:RsmE family RNA methyltransferase [Gemmatimonadaceae bacterium]